MDPAVVSIDDDEYFIFFAAQWTEIKMYDDMRMASQMVCKFQPDSNISATILTFVNFWFHRSTIEVNAVALLLI